MRRVLEDPFRLFFPWGTLWALVAVVFWPIRVFNLGFFDTSTKFHSYLQIYGFMFSFVIGFLTTAVPRLTRTDYLRPLELVVLFFLQLMSLIFLFQGNYTNAHIAFISTIFALLGVLLPRFLKRKRNPPATFVFIPFAFLSAILGAFLLASARAVDLGNVLLMQGFVIFLLMGVGGFLIRSILGWGGFAPADTAEKIQVPDFSASQIIWHGLIAAGILASFPVEVFLNYKLGYLIRAVSVSVELIWQFKIYKINKSGKLSANTLQLSLVLLVCGLWGMFFAQREFGLAFLHLCFAGGFAFSTFSVATRVIFSHCGCSELLTGFYRPFTVALWFMFFGLIVRFFAEFSTAAYFTHLAYAGGLWSLGVLIWAFSILPKCINMTKVT